MESDIEYMRLAVEEALAAQVAGEVPVGAVLVSSDGQILGRGNNQVIRTSDPTAHAEIIAMRAAGRTLQNYRLLNTTLYCTLEPCPMCAGAIIHARVARLVYASLDLKAGACGSAVSILNHPALNHRIEVVQGVLAEECSTMLTNFFRGRRAEQALQNSSDVEVSPEPRPE